MEKIKLTQAVIVEGRYDKIKLASLLDAFIIETDGFQIFKDKEKLRFIRKLAQERGIVVLTDSDHAGFMIRSHISSAVPKEHITHVYIPDVYGKEKRKKEPSKEGKLGVEGMTTEVLLKALEQAGVTGALVPERERPITAADLFELGLSGTPNAKAKRRALLQKLELPEFLSTASLLSLLNHNMSFEEFVAFVNKADLEP